MINDDIQKQSANSEAQQMQGRTEGDGASLIQNQFNVTINQTDKEYVKSIVESCAGGIIDEKLRGVIDIYFSRAQQFADKLTEKIIEEKIQDKLNDPGILMAIHKAYRIAGSTEREDDYTCLSNLVTCRMKHGKDRSIRASVERAIDIVDQISDDAIVGLNMYYIVTNMGTTHYNLLSSINLIDDIYSKIMNKSLPVGNAWLEHLDILKTIRLYPPMIKYEAKFEYCIDKIFKNCFIAGIKKDSKEYNDAINICNREGLHNIFVENELLDGYVKVFFDNRKDIDELYLVLNGKNISLASSQKEALNTIFDMYDCSDNVKNILHKKILDEALKKEHIMKVAEWFDSIRQSLSLTMVGRVLAHSNIKEIIPGLPDMPIIQ